MSHTLRRMLTVLGAGLVILGLTGCQSSQPTHQKWVNAAEGRWHRMRSGLMLQMAQQQFDTGDLEQAEKTVQEALATDPNNAPLYTLAGRIMLERNQLERSFHLFHKAVELNAKMPEPHYFEGLVLQRWQRYPDALQSYQQAYELKPDHAPYLLVISDMLVAMDRLDEAMALLEAKREYFDSHAGLRTALGRIHTMRGQHAQAVAAYREALALQPDSMQILEELAMSELAAQQNPEALSHLRRLCQEPTLAYRSDLQRALGQALFQTGRVDEARDIYQKLIRRDPMDSDAWLNLAQIAWKQEDLGAALLASQRVMAVAPERAEGYLMAGMVLQKRGQNTDALALFQRASEAAPTQATAEIMRGIILEQTGQRQAAIQAFSEAVRRQPQDIRARQLLAAVSAREEP